MPSLSRRSIERSRFHGIRVLLVSALGVGGLVVVGGAALAALFFAFGPELTTECGQDHRTVFVDADLGRLTEQRAAEFGDTLGRGQPTSLTLTESEVTSAVLTFTDTDRISEVTVCFFGNGEGEARLKLDIPGLPDRVVKVRGSVDLTGEHLRVRVSDADLGGLGVLMELGGKQAIEGVINGLLDEVSLPHTYVPSISEGQIVVSGRPGR